jgi:hypothetical protein
MKQTGIANLPLHPGHAPKWLFGRMVKLAKGMTEIMVLEYGQDEFLRRISDPFWFQAFSCVLGFDWHSSGTTTVTLGALKEALNPEETGLAVAGGKGRASRKTPQEIQKIGDLFSLPERKIESLVYSSRMSAKVDNTALQDGFNLYHHVFIFTEKGKWSVIQQGLNENSQYARRYHWLSEDVKSFVEEPHSAICSDLRQRQILNMVARESEDARKISTDLAKENPRRIRNLILSASRSEHQSTLNRWFGGERPIILSMPRKINWKVMNDLYDIQPKNYEELISSPGIGPSTVRALALISDLIYGKPPSWSDPVKYNYAHGGKDGVPYPIDRKTYDKSIEMLETGIREAKIGNKERIYALKRLNNFIG